MASLFQKFSAGVGALLLAGTTVSSQPEHVVTMVARSQQGAHAAGDSLQIRVFNKIAKLPSTDFVFCHA